MISCSTVETLCMYMYYSFKYKYFFYICVPFSSVLGRLAVNGENLLPNHPEGCPAEVQASYPCFIAGQ